MPPVRLTDSGKGSVQIHNLEGVQRALRSLEGGLQKELRVPGLAAATRVAVEARSLVPVASGDLRGTIRPLASQRGAKVAAGNARVPYAGVTEWGGTTPKRNHAGRTKRRPAQRFLGRAVERTRDDVVRIYETVIDFLIRKHGLGG